MVHGVVLELLIIFQNSFAHNPNPKKLLFNVKKLMHIDSTLIIQTSQADMCKKIGRAHV